MGSAESPVRARRRDLTSGRLHPDLPQVGSFGSERRCRRAQGTICEPWDIFSNYVVLLVIFLVLNPKSYLYVRFTRAFITQASRPSCSPIALVMMIFRLSCRFFSVLKSLFLWGYFSFHLFPIVKIELLVYEKLEICDHSSAMSSCSLYPDHLKLTLPWSGFQDICWFYFYTSLWTIPLKSTGHNVIAYSSS